MATSPNCQSEKSSPSLLETLQSFRYTKRPLVQNKEEKGSGDDKSTTLCKTPEPQNMEDCRQSIPETPESLISNSKQNYSRKVSLKEADSEDDKSDSLIDNKDTKSNSVLWSPAKSLAESISETFKAIKKKEIFKNGDVKTENEDPLSSPFKIQLENDRCSKGIVDKSSSVNSSPLSSAITEAFKKISKRSSTSIENENVINTSSESVQALSVHQANKRAKLDDYSGNCANEEKSNENFYRNSNSSASETQNSERNHINVKSSLNTGNELKTKVPQSHKEAVGSKKHYSTFDPYGSHFDTSGKDRLLHQLSRQFPDAPQVLIHDFLIKNKMDVIQTRLDLCGCFSFKEVDDDSNDSGSLKVFPKKGVMYSSEDEDSLPPSVSANGKKIVSKGVVYSSEEEDEEEDVEALPETIKKKKKCVVYSSEEEDEIAISKSRKISKKSKGVIYSSEEEDNSSVVDKAQMESSDDDMDHSVTEDTNLLGSDSEDDYVDPDSSPERLAILQYFEEASLEELLIIPGCSKKKAEIILGLKPFGSWSNLVEKFEEEKFLSSTLLDEAKKVLHARVLIEKLMNKCEEISKRMSKIVTNLMENSNCQGIEKQPSSLCSDKKLASYQLIGLNWLVLMKNQNLNGILADEMGLGKTIQIISFLAHELEEENEGPHLIVVPASTLDNWEHELKAWCPDLSILMYYGSQAERRRIRQNIIHDKIEPFNIFLTTYNMVISSSEDRSLIKSIFFDCVIFDEAHLLKNMHSQRYKKLMKIRAGRRFLLTGTPLQNNLVELMSLLIFVMPHIFEGTSEEVMKMFSIVGKTGSDQDHTRSHFEEDKIELAKRIMRPFVLRRLKKDVLQDLPKKSDKILFCNLSPNQETQYTNLVSNFSQQVKESQGQKLSSSGISMIMQLRKLANHPLLLRYHYTDEKLREMSKLMLKEPTHYEANPEFIFEDMQVMHDFELHRLCNTYKHLKRFKLEDESIFESGKIMMLEKLLPELKSNGDRVLIFSQFTMMMDILEEYLKIREYRYVRFDGSTKVTDRQQLIDQYMTDKDIFIFLLSTKAGGLGINLTAANTVIIHDIDVNPYNDKQAEDRCHRVGQTRPVSVSRFISKDTIEEMILTCTKKKMKLEQDLTSSNLETNISTDDMVSLLKTALGV